MPRLDGIRVEPPSTETLKALYVGEGLTAKEIAAKLSFNPRQIKNLMTRRGINKASPVRMMQKLNLTPEILHDLYVAQKKTAGQIAALYGEQVGRIRGLIAQSGISCRQYAPIEPALQTPSQVISQSFLSRSF